MRRGPTPQTPQWQARLGYKVLLRRPLVAAAVGPPGVLEHHRRPERDHHREQADPAECAEGEHGCDQGRACEHCCPAGRPTVRPTHDWREDCRHQQVAQADRDKRPS
jgi:hypothetical protein